MHHSKVCNHVVLMELRHGKLSELWDACYNIIHFEGCIFAVTLFFFQKKNYRTRERIFYNIPQKCVTFPKTILFHMIILYRNMGRQS